MFRPCNPTKDDIERWLEKKELKFAQKDNRSSNYTSCHYLHRYLFTDIHETFFYYSLEFLQEWILRLKENHRNISIEILVNDY
jgi:hypothetical protein